jgi:hypothetical protein
MTAEGASTITRMRFALMSDLLTIPGRLDGLSDYTPPQQDSRFPLLVFENMNIQSEGFVGNHIGGDPGTGNGDDTGT